MTLHASFSEIWYGWTYRSQSGVMSDQNNITFRLVRLNSGAKLLAVFNTLSNHNNLIDLPGNLKHIMDKL